MGGTFSVTLFGVPFVLDEWVGVNVPKTVFIQNYRLGLIDGFLKLCVIAYVVTSLLINGDKNDIHSEAYSPSSIISYWTDSNTYSADAATDMRSDLCNEVTNRKYDYWYSSNPNSAWHYDEHGCTYLHRSDRSFKMQDSMFIPTYSQTVFDILKTGGKVSDGGICSAADCDKTVLGECGAGSWTSSFFDSDGNCVCQCASRKNEFAVGVEGIEVAFLHLPAWPVKARAAIEAQGMNVNPKNQKEVDGKEMRTIVRDTKKKTFKVFETDEEVKISVRDLLKLAGDMSLDSPHTVDNKDNFLMDSPHKDQPGVDPSILSKKPYMRVTGATVNIMISYHNGNSDINEHRKEYSGEIVCYVDIEIIPRWTGFPVSDINMVDPATGEKTVTGRYYQGLKINFIPSGKFEFFSLTKLLTYLASAIVYLSVPNFLMVLFTKFCLGTLSEMYYKAQCTLLDFWELFSGQVVRALVGLYCYNAIAAKGEKHSGASKTSTMEMGKNRVLGKEYLHECLVDLFEEHDGLDEDEIDTIQRVLTKVLDKEVNHTVSQQAFVEAAVNADVGNMKGWAKLFDKDRRPCCMERLFDTNIGARRAVTRKAKEDPLGLGADVVEVAPEGEESETTEKKVAPEGENEAPPTAPVVDEPKPDEAKPADGGKEAEKKFESSCTI